MTIKTKHRLVHLDPNEVDLHPNVRRDLGDLRGLTNSVKALGVLVPVVVVPKPDADGYLLVFGQRRRAAAIAAERELPVIIGSDLDDASRIAQQLAENLHRKDLTTAEEATAYEQLAALDLSDTAIARAVGVSRQHVVKARTVAASEVACTVAERYDLTLDQALVLAEFQDDREAVRDLTVTARKDPGRFAHLASRLRQDRERAAERADVIAQLIEAGYTILENGLDATALVEITDRQDGRPISTKEHAACPGRAVVVPEWDPNGVRHYCQDPDGNGHRKRSTRSTQPSTAPMSEEQKAERREVIENNKAWRAAEPVRREYVTALLARKTPPKGTLRFVAERILAYPERVGDGDDGLVAELLGAEAPTGPGRSVGATYLEGVADARILLALLAQVAADAEQAMGTHTWRRRDPETAAWLAWLASTGYSLSDIEQHVVTLAQPAPEAVDGGTVDEVTESPDTDEEVADQAA